MLIILFPISYSPTIFPVRFYYLFIDAFELGLAFVSGGQLEYPAVPEELDPEGYRRFTASLVLASQINDKVYSCIISLRFYYQSIMIFNFNFQFQVLMRTNHRDYSPHTLSTWGASFRTQRIFMEKMSGMISRRYEQPVLIVPGSCFAVLNELRLSSSCHFFYKVSYFIVTNETKTKTKVNN